MWTIKNNELVLAVSENGAEVHSLKKVNDDYDYRYLSFKEVCELEKKMTGVSYNLCHSLEEMFGNILIDEVCKNVKSKPRATK